jgi:hypothetical protein
LRLHFGPDFTRASANRPAGRSRSGRCRGAGHCLAGDDASHLRSAGGLGRDLLSSSTARPHSLFRLAELILRGPLRAERGAPAYFSQS